MAKPAVLARIPGVATQGSLHVNAGFGTGGAGAFPLPGLAGGIVLGGGISAFLHGVADGADPGLSPRDRARHALISFTGALAAGGVGAAGASGTEVVGAIIYEGRPSVV